MSALQLSREIAGRVLATVDMGLVKGMGRPEPGKMCVEAAVCFALGLPHGDDPPCVSRAVRSFKIALNDANWSSDKARANGLRRLAIAQLGSETIDDALFVKEVTLVAIKQVVPIALRAAAKIHPAQNHKDALQTVAQACEKEGTREAADAAANVAYAAYAAEYAARNATNAAANAARNARNAANAAYAADAAAYAAYATNAAAYAAYAARNARDTVLAIMAEAGVQALIKCGSTGCEWLDLCEEKAP